LEIIPQPGGFVKRNIARNQTDVYRIVIWSNWWMVLLGERKLLCFYISLKMYAHHIYSYLKVCNGYIYSYLKVCWYYFSRIYLFFSILGSSDLFLNPIILEWNPKKRQ
jgi:hypothetical protein